jgi:hypothetical protein
MKYYYCCLGKNNFNGDLLSQLFSLQRIEREADGNIKIEDNKPITNSRGNRSFEKSGCS